MRARLGLKHYLLSTLFTVFGTIFGDCRLSNKGSDAYEQTQSRQVRKAAVRET